MGVSFQIFDEDGSDANLSGQNRRLVQLHQPELTHKFKASANRHRPRRLELRA